MSSKDRYGSTPVQLAFDKGHRYLGRYLMQQHHHLKRRKFCGKNKGLERVVDLQLAPIIWVLIMGLLFVFINKVREKKQKDHQK